MLIRSRLLPKVSTVLLTAVLATSEAQTAVAREVHRFDVSPTNTAQAIQSFGLQSGVQIIAAGEGLEGKRLNVVTGEHSVDEGLRLLLAGTGLTHQYVGERAVALVPQTQAGDDLRVAQATPAAPPAAQSTPAPASSGEELSEFFVEDNIVVVGSRLRLEEAEKAGLVTTFDRQQIEQLGASNVADVLNYLPQQSFSQNESTNSTGSRTVRLRGLGLGTTLVLINGRRTVTSSLTSTTNFFDLNTIPLAAVERVEVLSDSASAVYGADAVGGVVNIVLRNISNDPFVNVYYGAADGGADERRLSAGLGHEGERHNISVILDAFDRDILTGDARDRWANADYTRFGSVDRRVATSNPGNISSRTAANLPGLNSTFAAVPVGSSGVGLTPSSFAATAGTRNMFSSLSQSSIVPEAQRLSGTVLGEFKITDRTSLFGEVLYVDREDERLAQPSSLNNAQVAANNPFNPFGVAVNASFLFADPQTTISESDSLRAVAGIKGWLGEWDWEFSALEVADNGTSSVENVIDAAKAAAALASTNAATALNVFQDGPGGSPELIASLRAPVTVNNLSSDTYQGSSFIRGPLPWELPGGAVNVVFGAEGRREHFHFENKQSNIFVTEDRDVAAVFTEARVPFVNRDMGVPLVDSLAITLAGRYDDYSDFGDTFNPQYGLEWGFIPQLAMRASYGTSFRPPSLYELYQPATTVGVAVIDPRRNNETTPNVALTSAGNPNLEPEESDSLSVGLVFTPGRADGLRTAVTYWTITQDQRVQRPLQSIVLANEAFFANRITRANPLPADIAAGRPGRLTALNLSAMNFGELETDGVDLQLTGSWNTSFGRLAPNISATWVNSYTARDFATTPEVERVGIANSQGTIPRWRATSTLAWTWHGLGVTPAVRWTSGYHDVNNLGALTGKEVSSLTLVDLQASANFGELLPNSGPWLDGFSMRLGVFNLLDKEAPFAEVGAVQGYDSSQGELRQRFAYLYLQKAF